MAFGKYKNEKSADLVHKIELFDFATGDPAMIGNRRQFITVLGDKSRAYQNLIEGEEARKARKKGAADSFTFAENTRVLARRMTAVVVAALIDVGTDEAPDVIDFADISKLGKDEREAVKAKLREAFTEITDLTIVVHEEVAKSSNFLPTVAQTLSDMLNSERTTEQPQTAASNPV